MLRSVLVLSALVLRAAAPAAAQSSDFIGPLRIRDLSPLSLFRLDMPPAHAVNSVEKGWGFEAVYSRGNLFLVSYPIEQWLETRGSRRPLTEGDIEEILELPGDVFYFDGEVSTLNLTAAAALNRDWQASVTFPLHWYGGGYFDRIIESFHRAAGLGQAGRDFVPQNEVLVFAKLGDADPIIVSDDGTSGLGDAIVTLRYGHQIDPRWHLIAEAAARLPTGREHLYFSKSKPDFGAQLSLQHLRDSTGYYASLSWINVGDDPIFPAVSDTPTLTLAVEQKIWDDETSAIAQATWSRSTVAGVERSDLTKDRTQLSVGLRRRKGPFTASIGLTENIVEFKNTPDISVHVGIGYIVIRH